MKRCLYATAFALSLFALPDRAGATVEIATHWYDSLGGAAELQKVDLATHRITTVRCRALTRSGYNAERGLFLDQQLELEVKTVDGVTGRVVRCQATQVNQDTGLLPFLFGVSGTIAEVKISGLAPGINCAPGANNAIVLIGVDLTMTGTTPPTQILDERPVAEINPGVPGNYATSRFHHQQRFGGARIKGTIAGVAVDAQPQQVTSSAMAETHFSFFSTCTFRYTCADLNVCETTRFDGCNRELECGGCDGGLECVSATCCPPVACDPEQECGFSAEDVCGRSTYCGACPEGQSCDGYACE